MTIITMLGKCVDLVCKELTAIDIDSALMTSLRFFLLGNDFLGPIDLKVKMKKAFSQSSYNKLAGEPIFKQLNSLILKSQSLQDKMYEADIELVLNQGSYASYVHNLTLTHEEAKTIFYRNNGDVVNSILEISTGVFHQRFKNGEN